MKIGDFGASTIDGYEFADTACEDIEYELPCRGREFDDRPVLKRELFALGSAIYEIMAWVRPFKGLGDAEVEARYAREEFPSLADITAGPVISSCWDELYEGAEEVVVSLKRYLI